MCYVFNAAGLYWDLNQFQSEVSFIVRKSLLSNHDGGKKINNVWTIPGFSRPQRGNTKWQGRSHGRKDANRLQNVGQTECQASFLCLRQSVNISKSANIFYYWTRNWKGKSFFTIFQINASLCWIINVFFAILHHKNPAILLYNKANVFCTGNHKHVQ